MYNVFGKKHTPICLLNCIHNLGISSGKSHFSNTILFLSFLEAFSSVPGLKRQFFRLVFLNNLVVCLICLPEYI